MHRLAFFVLFPAFLFAQPAPSKNEDGVWSVTLEQDWVIDNHSLQYEWDNGLRTLKLLCNRDDGFASSPFLSVLIYNAVSQYDPQIYEDPDCRIPTDWFTINLRLRTVTLNDPETGEEKIMFASCSDYDAYQAFEAWRLRQVLTYDEKTAEWRSTVQAIAPLVQVNNTDGDSIGLRPEFWFRPENKRPDLNSKNIIWAKQVTNRWPETVLSIDRMKPRTGTDSISNLVLPLRRLLENNMNIPLYEEARGGKLLTPEMRRNLLPRIDSVNSGFYDWSDDEKRILFHQDMLKQVHELRFVQTWYWDARRKRLSICLDAVAPVMDIYDPKGNFRYKDPLFYRRTWR